MNNTITLTDEQMKALQSGQSITIEPPKPSITKWEPKGTKFTICNNLEVANFSSNNIEVILSGMTYGTKSQAEQAAKALRSYARQLAYLAENDDGWSPDWLNGTQPKFYIYFDTCLRKYEIYSSTVSHNLGTQYMSKNNAQKLCQLLNDGIVEF
jgi:hypothetical protein